jgi:predicted alpha/beta hydrolase
MLADLVTLRTPDAVELDGALYRAPAPVTPTAQVLMVHGLTWNFYRGPARWLPPRLAGAGYTCLSLNMRDHDLAEPRDFDLAHHDLRAGIDALFDLGARTVIVLGHGYACNKIVRYPARSDDHRIRHWILTTMGSVKRHRPDIWRAGLEAAAAMTGQILVVQGAIDASLEGRARGDELAAAATSARVEVRLLEGGNHYFDQRHDELAAAVIGWLRASL